ncbi:ROK family protein [Mucilaginibacter litoreus]|uniref:ROK family protein n=1 Tax=Mucilaginibacter litoreus TaxID=1048221 RepID=A0ABW3AZ25_9SPHI
MKNTPSDLRILSVDIGGSSVKATILDSKGNLTMDYQKVATPKPANPDNIVKAIKTLVKDYPEYDRISVGFPGYVRNGIVKTAPNLGTDFWADVNFANQLKKALSKETKVVNDADMQGLGVVNGKGLEMVITLGTGFGTALLMDGHLLPHLEVSHHPVSKGRDYDQYIGDKALDEIGEKKWNRRIKKVFKILKTVFNYDYLYIGGGNSDLLDFKLDDNMKIVTNADGIKGGAKLWQEDQHPVTHTAMATPTK